MATFFTADEHHAHENMIEYANRPFKNAEECSTEIVERHNAVVKEGDTVWHLGDFSMLNAGRFSYYLKLISRYRPVRYRHLVLGNHDHLRANSYLTLGFSSVHTMYWNEDFILAHDHVVLQKMSGIRQVKYDQKIILCGHVHNLFKKLKGHPVVNVGVDVWDFTPVRFEKLIELVEKEE